jgi:hypothetical protein
MRGASTAQTKRELGWTLRYPSWRQGFAAVYASRAAGPSLEGVSAAQPATTSENRSR